LKNKPVDISGLRHLYPYESHYLDLNGFKYHYLDEGQGEPLVMVHGNPTWSFYFRELINKLSPQFRTIVPDHMGCGLSDKPDIGSYGFELENRVDDLEMLLDHLDLGDNITLILHDWGGMIGMAYAVRHPERIRRLILLNTYAFLPPADYRVPLAGHFIRRAGPLAALAVLGLNLFSVGALYLASRKGLARDVKKGLTAPYNCWNHRIAVLRFVQDIPLCPDDSSYELAKTVDDNLSLFSDTPILICWGDHDFVFNHNFLDEWQRRFPKAEVHRFSDAGHYVLEDVPEKIVPLVQDFLQRRPL
jgi:pimeloyl-ACP methyl ester carboxylesterase